MDYQKIIEDWILKNISNISFENFSKYCHDIKDTPSYTITQLKQKNTKMIGDIFEMFCKLYLLHIGNYQNVWLYNDVPYQIKQKLNLTNNDMGIDIIAQKDIKDDKYIAVQCKFRNRNKNNYRKNAITWKDLSTFYALVSRTGPYQKYIIMTNADYIRRIGKKQPTEKVIAYQTFNNMKLNNWLQLSKINHNGHNISDEYNIKWIKKHKIMLFESYLERMLCLGY